MNPRDGLTCDAGEQVTELWAPRAAVAHGTLVIAAIPKTPRLVNIYHSSALFQARS